VDEVDQTPASPTLKRVLKGELCAGCGLCAGVSNGAVEMRVTPPGYSRPVQIRPIPANTERRIAQACPGAVVAPWNDMGGEVDPYWGPHRVVTTGAAVDPDVRYEGSSGGAISALLIHALRSGMVDRVIQIGADPGSPSRNVTIVSRTPEEVLAAAGSRYTASSPLASLEDILSDEGPVAFVGKPCDISALRQVAASDERIGRRVALMISFFCGGIPSHDGVGRILSSMSLGGATLRSFRYRGRGWPGNCIAETIDGRRGEMTYAESWGRHLSKEVQFRCKICPDAVGGVADIACADAWYGDESGYPSFEEEEGRSLIIGRTEMGERLLASALTSGVLEAEPLPITEIVRMQPAQGNRKSLILARMVGLKLIGQPTPRVSGLWVGEAARRASKSEFIRNLLGTVRRTLRGTRSRM
jgi:coenzyme F420 hydrogenase subunit beta